MTGHDNDYVDPEKMPNKEMHAHFTKLLVGRVHDVETRIDTIDSRLADTMEKIDGLETSFNSRLDAVLARLPAPAPAPPPAPRPKIYLR
jgi:hypothetical protein